MPFAQPLVGAASVNLIFAGTPEFAARCLAALIQSSHRVGGVLTQPDRPAGRGLAPLPSPVKKGAAGRGIPIFQPASLKNTPVQEELRRFHPDAIIVAAYGLILPQSVLEIPRFGALNIHASLLPRWRGATPIQRALLAGDRETGIGLAIWLRVRARGTGAPRKAEIRGACRWRNSLACPPTATGGSRCHDRRLE